MYGALAAALSLVVGKLSDPPRPLPDGVDGLPGVVRLAVEGACTSLAWGAGHRLAAAIAVAVALLPAFLGSLAAVMSMLPRRVVKDPRRLFSPEARRGAVALAGGRCEGEWLPFVRCRGPAAQADHWVPWSRGGATSQANLVMLCGPHNRAKSDKLPTTWTTRRLVRRRRRYYPPDLDPRPGHRYRAAPRL